MRKVQLTQLGAMSHCARQSLHPRARHVQSQAWFKLTKPVHHTSHAIVIKIKFRRAPHAPIVVVFFCILNNKRNTLSKQTTQVLVKPFGVDQRRRCRHFCLVLVLVVVVACVTFLGGWTERRTIEHLLSVAPHFKHYHKKKNHDHS